MFSISVSVNIPCSTGASGLGVGLTSGGPGVVGLPSGVRVTVGVSLGTTVGVSVARGISGVGDAISLGVVTGALSKVSRVVIEAESVGVGSGAGVSWAKIDKGATREFRRMAEVAMKDINFFI